MARIRTIKPEFPQSESMGNVSRDARLCFLLLWTLSDDSGRLRGASRLLASLLFPYDEDAPELLPTWLAELEREGCIAVYEVGGSTYIQITNWLSHQKIDKPSQSKIPEFEERYRILANPRESSPLDQGPKDQGPKDHSEAKASAAPSTAKDRVWKFGVELLGEGGRGLLGKLVAQHSEEAVDRAITAAMVEQPGEPKAWLVKACEAQAKLQHRADQLGCDAELLANPKPQWALDAGFKTRFEAENEGCHKGNAHQFRDGRRVQ